MAKFTFGKIAVAALSAVGLSALTFGAAGCLPKSTDMTEPDNMEISRTAPPDDGSLPTAHTCAENLAYIIYVFDSQPQYHTYSYGVTSASIATQTTRNFRDFKDGVLLNTDLTYSTMVKGGTQTCSMYNGAGEYEVYFRTSETPEADTLPSQAVWSEDAPTFFNEKSYHFTYGLLPNELFNYIVNEENIIDSEQIKVNSDGTYTQNFTLDPVASTYYYQFGMKTRGGLSGYPDFESITFSVTFDRQWQILSATMHEVAKVNKGIVVPSVSDFNTRYWYGDDNFDEEHYSFYENYFKKYLGDSGLEQGGPTDEKLTVDVTNVLSNGFSQIMNGGAQFEIAINLGVNRYVGYAFVSLDLANPLESLVLKVSLGKSLREQTLYIEYGNDGMAVYYGKDFALGANLSEVKLAIGELGEIINKIKSAFAVSGESASAEGETAVAAEGGDPLTELMDSMTLAAGEKQAVLTLDTDDLLGLGIGINAKLVFGINNNKITFRSGTVGNLSVSGEKIDLDVNIATTTAAEIGRVPSETGADLAEYIADVHSLLGADLLKATVILNGDGEKVSIGALKGLNAKVTAYAALDGVTVGADAEVSYTYKGNKVSAKANVWYGYDASQNNYGKAIVCLTEFNGAPLGLKVKCDIKEVADALATLFAFGGDGGGIATERLASVLSGALSSDFSSLLTELYADRAQIKVGLSVDALLDILSVNTDIEFGSCTLKYVRGEGVYGGKLSAELPALGLGITVCGEGGALAQPDGEDCLDLFYLIGDIKEIADADLLKAHIFLDGSAEGVTVKELNGITAELDVYVNLENAAVAAALEIGYSYGGDRVSAKLSVWYENGGSGLGKIVLSLNEINGAPLAAKVYCDITEIKDAVTALFDYADIKLTPFESADGGPAADIISQILGADFAKLFPVLENGSDRLNISLNADEILSLLNVNADISLGNVSFAYDRTAESKLTAKAPALGISAEIVGAAGKLAAMPAPADCLNLTQLVNVVQAVWEQVDGIIDGQSISFEIIKGETFLSLDGILVEIWGEGEIAWKKGGEYVALDLAMAITERASDVATLKFIYDKNAENEPLVKLALNGAGIEIYKDDIESVKSGFNDIYNKVMALLGKDGEITRSAEPSNGSKNAFGTLTANDALIGVLFGVLASDGWVDELNNITLKTDGKSVALSYISGNAVNVEIGADGGLSLFYDGAFGERFTLGGGIVASATAGDLRDVIEGKLKNCKMSSSKTEGSAGFVKLAYDYLFEAISAIDVSNILGSDTYTVTFKLNGANTNIDGLENVYIGAEIYFTGANGAQPKLAEANLDIDAAGVVIKLNVISERHGNNTHFYINLSQVMDIKLPDLKFKATQQSLYETLEVLISAVNDTDILNSIGKLLNPSDGVKPAESREEPVISDETADKLADLITKLLNSDFGNAVVATDVDGVMTATVDLDNIVKQLGFETGALGTVEAVINHNNHSMKTSGKTLVTDINGNTELKEWISLSSELTARRDYSKLDRSEYISVEFLPSLIDDVLKFATDENGELHGSFTLSGSINANLVGMIDVNIAPCTLTVKLGESGISLSLVMHVNKAKVIGIGIPESTVGLTYRNGLLTLAKGLDTSTPEYKVMTFDYFLDHMLTKKDSVLNWLLDISGWDLIMSFVKADVSSGLTSPEDISLFDAATGKDEKEISMYDFVDAISVVIGGNQTAVFGNYGALESDLGVTDNYYGFALNAGAVTNGVLTKLNAALTRGENGLDRVLASGAVQSYVTFSANLQYKESWTEEYEQGTALQGEKTAPDLYASALAKAAEKGCVPDFDYFVKKPDMGYDEKFGCMSVTVSGGDYTVSTDYSNILYSHTLTVVKLNGETEERQVRHGSTVRLYDNNSPVYADAGKTVRVLYSVLQNGVSGTQVIMNGDLTVYEVRRAAVSVVVHNGTEEYIVNSFGGDRVPASVDGLETITAPVYEDGTAVGENDILDGGSSVIHIYGTFVKSETVVNYVKYTFSAQTMSYTASGKAAGFNDYYSAKGNTLVLENEIGGYPVTAIAANAFANTEGKAIKSVIIPENVTCIGSGAFLDNVGMESAVILGAHVKVDCNSEKDNNNVKDQPFYGCSTETDGTSAKLVIYYNTVECGGSTANTIWTKFRVSGGAIKYRYYIGQKPSDENGYGKNGGGALYSGGSWQYVDYALNVDSNGVIGGTLGREAVENILAPYFPYATAGSYEGSLTETNVNRAMENGIANFTVLRGGITYACVYTAEIKVEGGRTTVTFNVSYKATAEIYVSSSVGFGLYGKNIAADTLTLITVPVEGETLSLPEPAHATHKFNGWTESIVDGKPCYTANWVEKAIYTVTVEFSGGLNNTLTMTAADGTATSQKTSGSLIKGYKTSFTFTVFEGDFVSATADSSSRELEFYVNGVKAYTFVSASYNFKSDSYSGAVTADVNKTFKY